jgi:hypothetical protein
MITALFILKLREDYSNDPSYSGSYQIATGMWNSAKFVVDTLNDAGISADMGIAIDANSIDAIVTQTDAKVVFIEGLWVTPEKFIELMALPRHAGRTWVVRIHSEIPFLSSEGIAMGWIAKYMEQGVLVACNAPRAHDQIMAFARAMEYDENELQGLLPYLPNCYPTDFEPEQSTDLVSKDTIDIACFGAFRPLKNHLQQAICAVNFAREHGKNLRFHINSRYDAGGVGPARNVRDLFANLPAQYELVEHGWESHEDFLTSLGSIDILMQVSFSETFNIVAADATFVGKPVVVSDEITWAYPLYADPSDHLQLEQVLKLAYLQPAFYVQQSRKRLESFATQSASIWVRYLTPFVE